MLNTKSFLAVDFGAGSLKLAEFEINEAGGLRLKSFSIKPLGIEGRSARPSMGRHYRRRRRRYRPVPASFALLNLM